MITLLSFTFTQNGNEFDLGFHTTFDDPNSKLDPEVLAISRTITPLLAKEFGVVWDLFSNRAKPFDTPEYQVLSRTYTAPVVTVQGTTGAAWDTNNATTGLPVSAGTMSRIVVGDILLVNNEIVVVSAVDRGANTISVYERGSGDTTAVAHGTSAITAKIIGNAHREGRVDGEAQAEKTALSTNYTQLIQEIVDLSHLNSVVARKTGQTEETLKREAMTRVIQDLARSAIYGVAREATSAIPATTRGLLSHLKHADGASAQITSVGGAFTETGLQNGLDSVRQAGGTVNAIVLNVKNKRTANGFSGADTVTTDRGDRVGGKVIDAYMADGFGLIPFIVDIDMPNGDVALVNTNSMEKGWLTGDELRFTEHTDTNPREKKTLLHGSFGLSMQNIGQTHHLLTALS